MLVLLLAGPVRADQWDLLMARAWKSMGGVPGAEIVPVALTMVDQAGEMAARAPLQPLIDALEGIRELEFRHFVPWHVKNSEGVREFFVAAMARDYPERQARLDTAMLENLGLVKPGFAILPFLEELFTEQIAGAYDPATRNFFVVHNQQGPLSRLLSAGGPSQHDILTVHELDHALGDQHFDLKKLQEEAVAARNTDRQMALQSLLEGDATLTMTEYSLLGSGVTADEGGVSGAAIADVMTSIPFFPGMGSFTSAPLYFKKALIFPYYNGMDLVQAARMDGGWPAVDAMYDDLPTSTEQIFHPERYLYYRDEPIDVSLAALPSEVGGWTALGDDTGGEFLVRVFLEQHGAAVERAAEGWGGDRYRVYARGDDSFLVWATVWDTPEDAVEFETSARSAISRAPGEWQLERRGQRVVLAHDLPASVRPSLWPRLFE